MGAKHSLSRKKVYLAVVIVSFVIALIIALPSINAVYANSKTDDLNSGQIKVSHCDLIDYNWKTYKCYGDYTSHAGMFVVPNVNIIVNNDGYQKGDYIEDMYMTSLGPDGNPNSFITGSQRRSVAHNLPYLIILLVSVILPLVTSMVFIPKISRQRRQTK